MAIYLGRFQILAKPESEWSSANPILLNGEFGVADTGSSFPVLKVGDGVRPWSVLPAIVGGGGAPQGMYVVGTTTTLPPGSFATVVINNSVSPPTISFGIPAGPAGPPNTLTIGTTTTGLPGTPASATITGTAPNQTLNLVIPRGDKGEQGDPGADGATGPPGPSVTFGDPTAVVGLTAVNGVGTNAMRADSAPPLSQAIIPTWTGAHTFNASVDFASLFRLSGAEGTAGQLLASQGAGLPAQWVTPSAGVTPGNPTALVGLAAINGVSADFMRADAAPALNQAIAPTWTGAHAFSSSIVAGSPTGGAQGAGTINAMGLYINGVAVTAGGGTPGGANTQVQYNNAGAFAGHAGLTYDSATSTLQIQGNNNVWGTEIWPNGSQATPTTGQTINMAANKRYMYLVPAGTLATLTVNLPASPIDGQISGILTTQTITAITIGAQGGGSVTTTVTTLPANTAVHFIAFSGVWRQWSGVVAAGGGVPGGATTQIQYNNAGAFAGSALLTWTNGTATLSLGSSGVPPFITTPSNAGAGTTITLQAGAATGAGNAGGMTDIQGGVPADGNGGAIRVNARPGVGTNRSGGDLFLNSGSNTGTGVAGSVIVTVGGIGTGTQGAFNVRTGTGAVDRLFINGNGSWGLGAAATVGTSGQVLTSQGAAPPVWSTVSSAPAGANTEVQYNNAGAFGASSLFTWNNTTQTLTLGQNPLITTSAGSTIQMGAQAAGTTTSNGNVAQITGGSGGSTSGNGGDSYVVGGTASNGNGGSVFLSGRNGTGTDRSGGGVTITAGNNTGTGTGGSVQINAGAAATGTPGSIQLRTGPSGGTDRLFINGNGSWGLGAAGTVGSSGQVLTSQGAAPPIWTTPSGGVTPAALTRVDDTNVTLTLGGTPATALLQATSLTLGWTGTLAVPRGGTGAGTLSGYVKGNGTSAFTAVATIPYSDITGGPAPYTPAALTRVDDTNVTLTLGGTPASALLQATSLTLGWTGTLAVARGGSGAGTLTGYVKGNGTSAFTASATIPYSDITGGPTAVTGANPTATIGLAAVNGSAGTFMRSDAAPPLSQSITPTWTGAHTFTNGVTSNLFTVSSSRAIKRETGRISRAADVLSRLRPVLYRLLAGDDREQLGLIAEEVHEICPQLSDGKSVSYDRLALLLLADWQERRAVV